MTKYPCASPDRCRVTYHLTADACAGRVESKRAAVLTQSAPPSARSRIDRERFQRWSATLDPKALEVGLSMLGVSGPSDLTLITSGAEASVMGDDTHVVRINRRLGFDRTDRNAVLAKLADAGAPIATPLAYAFLPDPGGIRGRSVELSERLSSAEDCEQHYDEDDNYVAQGRLLAELHSVDITGLTQDERMAIEYQSTSSFIDYGDDDEDEGLSERIEASFEKLNAEYGLPQGFHKQEVVVHLDAHQENVMQRDDGSLALIDLTSITIGRREADLEILSEKDAAEGLFDYSMLPEDSWNVRAYYEECAKMRG